MNSTKITVEKISAMREMWGMGYGSDMIANALGVNRSTVNKYCKGLRQPSRHKMSTGKRMRLLMEWR